MAKILLCQGGDSSFLYSMQIFSNGNFVCIENIVSFASKLKNNRRNMKYVIIGGVAGGATAAARLRRVDEASDIVLLEKGSTFLMRIVDYLII